MSHLLGDDVCGSGSDDKGLNAQQINIFQPLSSIPDNGLSFNQPLFILPGAPKNQAKYLLSQILASSGHNADPKCPQAAACDLPACGEFHMRIEEASDLARGRLPAFDACSDQALSLLVAHHLHQPGVAFVDVFLQRRLQLLCKGREARSP